MNKHEFLYSGGRTYPLLFFIMAYRDINLGPENFIAWSERILHSELGLRPELKNDKKLIYIQQKSNHFRINITLSVVLLYKHMSDN